MTPPCIGWMPPWLCPGNGSAFPSCSAPAATMAASTSPTTSCAGWLLIETDCSMRPRAHRSRLASGFCKRRCRPTQRRVCVRTRRASSHRARREERTPASGTTATHSTNPWDFVLALEGAILFAGAATRRHQGAPESGASFPFTVHPTAAGWGGVAEADRTNVRAEFWAPLWDRPAGCDELSGLLKEGRAILHGKTARDGLDFARAASTLGISRGITAFQRYGFAMRQGNMYLAAPLGIRRVTAHVPEMAELINDFDTGGWLQQVRRVAQDKNAPARAHQVLKRFQDALFALTEAQVTPATVQNAIETLGEIVGWLATTPAARAAIRPPPLLRGAWVQRADDGTAEYRAAAALASLGWTLAPHRAEPARPDGAFPNNPAQPATHRPAVDPTGSPSRSGRSRDRPEAVPGMGTRHQSRTGGLGARQPDGKSHRHA